MSISNPVDILYLLSFYFIYLDIEVTITTLVHLLPFRWCLLSFVRWIFKRSWLGSLFGLRKDLLLVLHFWATFAMSSKVSMKNFASLPKYPWYYLQNIHWLCPEVAVISILRLNTWHLKKFCFSCLSRFYIDNTFQKRYCTKPYPFIITQCIFLSFRCLFFNPKLDVPWLCNPLRWINL